MPSEFPESESSPWRLAGLQEYVAIDLETTGLDSDTDSIIELGAIKFADGVQVDSFSTLVNPERSLPAAITRLTGITNEEVKLAPLLEDLAGEFIDFVGDLPIVGQNLRFDLGFLAAAPETSFHFLPAKVVPRSHDVRLLAQFVTPCYDSYGLAALSDRYQVSLRPNHRAADDAQATGEVFAKLLPLALGVPLPQIAAGIRFVEGTASPLLNTLRCLSMAINEGWRPEEPAPHPLSGSSALDRDNIYESKGDPRPQKPITDEQVRRFMTDRERFSTVLPDFEDRPQQADMAVAVHRALREDKILAVEAGTGVGKSLAYLVPALLCGKRVIASTFTRNLQDQLFYDEIPRLGRLFKFGFKAALMKGRRNYLCYTRWQSWANNPERVGNPSLRERAATAVRWVEASRTGDVAELGAGMGDREGSFQSLITSEAGFCTTRVCSGQECPLARIRKAAMQADILVVNHSLALLDLLGEGGLLGDAERYIFDEAHHLEDVATDVFGIHLNTFGMRDLLERAARVFGRGSELWTALAGNGQDALVQLSERVSTEAGALLDVAGDFFLMVRGAFAHRIPGDAQYAAQIKFYSGDREQQALIQASAALQAGLDGLTANISRLNHRLEDLDEDALPAGAVQEGVAVLQEVATLRDSVRAVVAADDPEAVYWLEAPSNEKYSPELHKAPLDVSETLAEKLWDRLKCAVLTSATLTTDRGEYGFNHLFRRTGIDRLLGERIATAAFDSPFDYARNRLVVFPTHVPSPAKEFEFHCEWVADICGKLAANLRRNILVLFTSYEAMRRVERLLEENLLGRDIELFSQWRSAGRERLVRRFRKAQGAVLLGTDALWEGIDVPGEGLELVVIPRLPFAMPGDPLVSSRIDKIKAAGGNAFYEYQIPAAVLKFRQGAGRLIRAKTDRGAVLVLDPRAATMSYGQAFRRALEGSVRVPQSNDELIEEVTRFFEGS